MKLKFTWLATILLCGCPVVSALAVPVPAVFPVTVSVQSLPSHEIFDITFTLYDRPLGGVALWAETKRYAIPASLQIRHNLGSVGAVVNPIDPQLLNRQLWVEGSAVMKGTVVRFPRVKLGVVPYAVRSELSGKLEGKLPAGQVEATGAVAGDVLTADGSGAASWQTPAGGFGGVSAVLTPVGGGLQGGAEGGPVSLGLLTSCGPDEILKWNGSAWACAQDADTNGGGTLTEVVTGAGLTGGPIVKTGTISVATGGIVEAMVADGAVTNAKITGPISASKLAVGTTAGTVAAGDHAHAEMGDVTAVNTAPGSGLTGGAGSGAVSLSVDTATIQARVGGACAPGSSIQAIAADGTVRCEVDDGGEGSTWSLAGNSGTNPTANFIGTTDSAPLELRVNNQRALRLERVTTTSGGTYAGLNVVGGDAGNVVTPGVTLATISGGGGMVNGTAAPNRVTDLGGTVSGGWRNQAGDGAGTLDDRGLSTVGGGGDNTASGGTATIAGGSGNTAAGNYSAVGGGRVNTASGGTATVAGGSGNAAAGNDSSIGGGVGNRADGGGATVAGGTNNTAGGYQSLIGGGSGNSAVDTYATVAGGSGNTAGYAAAVAGGEGNTAGGTHATASGGWNNTASGQWATVCGGFGNAASGERAVVPGGSWNVAGGLVSFAAGSEAVVRPGDARTFVWNDGEGPFESTGSHQFLIHAAAGVGINKNNPSHALDVAGTARATASVGTG